MASSQSVPGEVALAMTPSGFPAQPIPCNEVLPSQSWKWLMERFGSPPRVRLVLGHDSPQLTKPREISVEM